MYAVVFGRCHLMRSESAKNTAVDNIMVLVSLERILHPWFANATSVMSPSLIAAERLSVSERSAAMSLL